jgi:hypothetical protein
MDLYPVAGFCFSHVSPHLFDFKRDIFIKTEVDGSHHDLLKTFCQETIYKKIIHGTPVWKIPQLYEKRKTISP